LKRERLPSIPHLNVLKKNSQLLKKKKKHGWFGFESAITWSVIIFILICIIESIVPFFFSSTHFDMAEPTVRRSKRLGQIGKPKAATVVFEVPELLTEIINYCSWASRIRLSHATSHARLFVQDSIRQRIHKLIRPFVYNISSFFALIRELQAAIVGSAAWNVMSFDQVEPRDLNIVVPSGSPYGIERLKAFLSCAGTTITSDGSPGLIYEMYATRFVKLLGKSVSHGASTCET
jgi:hypothetical protein